MTVPSQTESDKLTELERRWLFSRLYSRWIADALARGYQVEQCEVAPLETRAERGTGQGFIDGVHKPHSRHYDRCAADPILWKQVNGEWQRITDGDDPAWAVMGELWESYHPLCHNGRRYHDANHISIRAADGRA